MGPLGTWLFGRMMMEVRVELDDPEGLFQVSFYGALSG